MGELGMYNMRIVMTKGNVGTVTVPTGPEMYEPLRSLLEELQIGDKIDLGFNDYKITVFRQKRRYQTHMHLKIKLGWVVICKSAADAAMCVTVFTQSLNAGTFKIISKDKIVPKPPARQQYVV
jgi:hypothetical protein